MGRLRVHSLEPRFPFSSIVQFEATLSDTISLGFQNQQRIGRAGILTMHSHRLTDRCVGQCKKLVGCNLVPTWFFFGISGADSTVLKFVNSRTARKSKCRVWCRLREIGSLSDPLSCTQSCTQEVFANSSRHLKCYSYNTASDNFRVADDTSSESRIVGLCATAIYHQVWEARTLTRYRLVRADSLLHKRAYRSNRAYFAFRFGAFAEFLAMALQQQICADASVVCCWDL